MEERNVPPSSKPRVRRHLSIFRRFNGLHPWHEWEPFVPECDALFKSERGGDRGPAVAVARIDCDRPEETCTPPLSVWGFSRCPPLPLPLPSPATPCKSTFIARALEPLRSAALSRQSSLVQIAHGSPAVVPQR